MSWGRGWEEELVKARVVPVLTEGLPNNRHGLWRAQGLGPLWLSSRSLNPNFLQLGLLLPFSLTCQLRGLTATRDRTWRCPIPSGASREQSRQLSWGYPLHLQTQRRLEAPGGEPGVGSLLLVAGLPIAPDESPAWEGKPGAPPPAVGIP